VSEPALDYGVIDIVVNLFTPTELEQGQVATDDNFRVKTRVRPEYRGGVGIEDYLQKMDRAGIERSFLIAVRSGDSRIQGSAHIPYERIAEVCARYPDRLSGLAGIDPSRGMDGLREFEGGIRDYGFVGGHLYPHWFYKAPDAAQYYPFYAKCCELDVPIMMQVGQCLIYQPDRRLPSVGRPITLDQVAIDFPELVLIGIHIGFPWHDEMISMAWKHDNVYIGLDAYAPKHWPASVVHFLNTYGQDKVLFGTDWPVIDPERAMDDVAALDLRAGAKRKVLRDNALRIFKLGG
jgi:predicted TIM-barrel fold metal-dependent hydrolase